MSQGSTKIPSRFISLSVDFTNPASRSAWVRSVVPLIQDILHVVNGMVWGTSPPVTGTWERGNRMWNSEPAVGQPKSWVCVESGTPGTWVSEGNL